MILFIKHKKEQFFVDLICFYEKNKKFQKITTTLTIFILKYDLLTNHHKTSL